jgi:hypothetical protein
MKILFNTITRFISTKPTPPMYGRWCLDYELSIQDRKVYLTNMDNCGCCGFIDLSIKSKTEDKSKEELKDDYYLLPYFL